MGAILTLSLVFSKANTSVMVTTVIIVLAVLDFDVGVFKLDFEYLAPIDVITKDGTLWTDKIGTLIAIVASLVKDLLLNLPGSLKSNCVSLTLS